jgi:hypothetical protein
LIIHKAKDGSIAITTFPEGVSDEDKADALKKFHTMHAGIYSESYEGDFVMPLNGDFRDAWTLKDNKIIVDAAKAAVIHEVRVRHARNAALKQLDVEQLRYLSDDAKLKELEDKKQILRELPANIVGLEWPELLEKI